MFEFMNMEETFVVTYAIAILLAVIIAVPLFLIFEKDTKDNEY